ncbi:hypothetical protein BDV59DRAFT_169502 [Aspergillus ambiguus]|uniref:uncharacterized protein n=1 Tax=Aspergillus ambiguus TaxID=176160 RepID=UPI003CCCA7E6
MQGGWGNAAAHQEPRMVPNQHQSISQWVPSMVVWILLSHVAGGCSPSGAFQSSSCDSRSPTPKPLVLFLI